MYAFRPCHPIRSELFVLDSCCSHRSCSTYGPLPFTFEPVWKRQLARPQPCIHYHLTAARPTLTIEVRCSFSIGPPHLRYKKVSSRRCAEHLCGQYLVNGAAKQVSVMAPKQMQGKRSAASEVEPNGAPRHGWDGSDTHAHAQFRSRCTHSMSV